MSVSSIQDSTLTHAPYKLSRGAPQIFVALDRIETLNNVRQIFHPAEKHPSNPVIRHEKPWEREGGSPAASMIYDEEEKIFKCWYQGVIGDKEGTTQYGPHVLCYAISKDGIHWEKPNLGLHEIDGSKKNNVVIPPTYHEGQDHWESVLKDPLDPDPKRRYKGFGWSSLTQGLHTMTSPDGLHWTHSPNIVVPGGDSHAMMIDTLQKRYVVFVRGGAPRGVHYSTDFVNWSPRDNSALDWPHSGSPYNHMGFVYGDQYLGFVSWFHTDSTDLRFPRIDLHLLASKDGLHSRMVNPVQPVVPCGEIGEWDRFMTMLTGAPPIRVGNKLHIYYRGFSRRHKPYGIPVSQDTYEAGALGLATMRVDGFASLGAGFDSGHVTTKPVVFDGSKLFINTKADFGRVEVEVLDEGGAVIPGFSKEECLPVTTDNVDSAVAWRDRSDMNSLKGRTVRFRFYLWNARLYSYQVR
ncbi:MAG TPA: hypothetical protein VNJ09_06795 [Chthonomonadales bacterium]|nr:hypothetical protein [Chthonomonadales bacterium]